MLNSEVDGYYFLTQHPLQLTGGQKEELRALVFCGGGV